MLTVRYKGLSEANFLEGTCRELSEQGLVVPSGKPLPVGELVRFELGGAAGSQTTTRITGLARVSRSGREPGEAASISLKFVKLEDDGNAALAALLANDSALALDQGEDSKVVALSKAIAESLPPDRASARPLALAQAAPWPADNSAPQSEASVEQAAEPTRAPALDVPPISPPMPAARAFTLQGDVPRASFDYRRLARIALRLVLVGAIGAVGYLGYRSAVAWYAQSISPSVNPHADSAQTGDTRAASTQAQETQQQASPARAAKYLVRVVTAPVGANLDWQGQRATAPAELDLGGLERPIDVVASLPGHLSAKATIDRAGFRNERGAWRQTLYLALRSARGTTPTSATALPPAVLEAPPPVLAPPKQAAATLPSQQPAPIAQPEPSASKPVSKAPQHATKIAKPKAAAPSPEPTTAPPAESRLDQARACLNRADNACVLTVLDGKAQSQPEFELLIETLKIEGQTAKAKAAVQLYLKRYPTGRRADSYRHLLTDTAAP